MGHSTLITDYLGTATAASRPASPNLPIGCLGVFLASDTGVLSVWNGAAWTNLPGNSTAAVGGVLTQTGSIFGSGTITLNFGAGLSNSGGTLLGGWRATAVTALDASLTNTGGTLAATGASLTAGAGITSVTGGTIVADWNGGTVAALATNQLTDSGGTLALITGPTIAVTAQTTPLIVNANTSSSFPTFGANTEFVVVSADNKGSTWEAIGVAGTLTGNSGNSALTLGRMNGTLGAPSALGANDLIGSINIRGYSTSYVSSIQTWVNKAGSAWTGSNTETYQAWNTVANGATVASERMRLTSAGALLVGTTAAAGSEKLNVQGDIVASGTMTGGQLELNSNLNSNTFGAIVTNTNPGTIAYSSMYLQNDLTHYVGFFLSSSGNTVSGPDLALIESNAANGMQFITDGTTSPMMFCINGHTNEKMRLSTAGALLVGTTAAVGSEKLRVAGNVVMGGTATVNALVINAGSVITQPFGPGLTNSSGTLQVLPGHGLVNSGGTLLDQNQGTITLIGTTTGTLSPVGIDSALVNVGTANGTLAVSPGFTGQRLRLEIKQGATAHTVGFDTTVVFGTDVTSYTATASANARDIVQLICMDGTHWGVGAINHGFTI